MIDLNTPLEEVAALLPMEAARILASAPTPIQVNVLMNTRVLLAQLERRQAGLDPIQLEIVLVTTVGTLVGTVGLLAREITTLSYRASHAEALVEKYKDGKA